MEEPAGMENDVSEFLFHNRVLKMAYFCRKLNCAMKMVVLEVIFD